ncbi:anti-sigma F factor antagonist [Actinoplanes sp. SE50]|uniref:STAS domain-containing protein n=1 Tax=unclassified Actinoplanes TaxID=2626549 RepID=UPI00023EDD01|nr:MULTISPECIES: STAS domain-containing protein [unclassified Actinoplanes]AEV89107.1 Anti-sigma F factor antagonist [Actinoplanes sp. SE50/110]ATO87513.1 anti-sigma F factor antagonist [Actinoplanes sp. SE50]SLM04931.1 anti-sigma F factor antagonist [Actinoplanes sp. SE50/110]
MDLQLSARTSGACTVVKVGGEVDTDTVPQLEAFLQQVADGGGVRVVLDLADVSFLDSSGLGALIVWFKELQSRGGRLCVAAVQDLVAYVLRVAAVDQVVNVYDTVEAAEAGMPPSTA